jgi:excisionase family DNA binding protein
MTQPSRSVQTPPAFGTGEHMNVGAVVDAVAVRVADLVAERGEPLMDATAAGALLAVPKSWVLAEARAGRIPHTRLGHYVRFDRAALLAWRAQRACGPSTGSRPVSLKAVDQ